MEVLEWQPQTLRAKHMPWQPLKIMGIGDVQAGAEGADLARLKRHIEWGVRNDCYFLGMGDFTDFLSPSNRTRLKAAALYDTANQLIAAWHQKHLDDLIGVLEPTKDRWLGFLEGHHTYEFDDGSTSDTRIAAALGGSFLGTCGILRLNFRDEENKRSLHAHVWAHHGEGSGATAASPFNKLEKVSGFIDADVLMMGHFHRAGSILINKLHVAGSKRPRLRHRTVALVATGSFLRGYTQGSTTAGRPKGSYVEKGMMAPTALGNVVVTLTPRHREGEDLLDISCETMSV